MGETLRNVKTGYGGIRDIEFLVQFLQLLHGGDLPALRTGNTLLALDQLLNTGCVTQQEWELLSQGYSFLRKIEHRLQVMFDLQTHTIPEEPEELQKLALRMDYHVSGIDNAGKGNASATFLERFRFLTKANRNILDHVLNVFQNNEITAAEVDLLLDPQPKTETIQQILEKYGFEDCEKVMDEKNPYLSVRRCRHFLIAVVPELLQEIGHTPQPDQALVMLDAVAEALGDKGGLWELFSSNKPSLALFVRLCAFAPFLTDMLRADPGMLDGLMDSLVLDKIPPRSILEEALARLCVNAEQLEPILAGFKHDHLLPIGVRNLLRRSTVRATNVAISDVAQVCLKQVVLSEYAQLVRRHGTPILARDETVTDAPVSLCRFAILGLGKFGGREMNYHSDLDILPLFEGDGKTEPVIWSERGHFLPLPHAVESIPNQLFFNKLVQVLVKRLSHFGPWGKLYEVDLRLRPMGKSGALATSLSTLEAYFMDGTGELWERQMLTKARIVANTDMKISRANFKHFRLRLGDFLQHVMRTVRMIQYAYPLTESDIKEMRHMRSRLVNSNDDDQLKRSSGGMIDVEFIVQMLQLKLGSQKPGIVVSNTFDTLEKMRATGIISEADYETLTEGYAFLCSLTNSMCLLNQRTTTQIPSDEPTQVRLAKLAGYESTEKLIAKLNQVQTAIANCFDRFFPG